MFTTLTDLFSIEHYYPYNEYRTIRVIRIVSYNICDSFHQLTSKNSLSIDVGKDVMMKVMKVHDYVFLQVLKKTLTDIIYDDGVVQEKQTKLTIKNLERFR